MRRLFQHTLIAGALFAVVGLWSLTVPVEPVAAEEDKPVPIPVKSCRIRKPFPTPRSASRWCRSPAARSRWAAPETEKGRNKDEGRSIPSRSSRSGWARRK